MMRSIVASSPLRNQVKAMNLDDAKSVLHEAQEAFQQNYTRCFWYMKSDLVVTLENLSYIVGGLRKYGRREEFTLAWRFSKFLKRCRYQGFRRGQLMLENRKDSRFRLIDDFLDEGKWHRYG